MTAFDETNARDDDDAGLNNKAVSRAIADYSRGSLIILLLVGTIGELKPPFEYISMEKDMPKNALRGFALSWLTKGYLVFQVADIENFGTLEKLSAIFKARVYVVTGLPLQVADPVLRIVTSELDTLPYLQVPLLETAPVLSSGGRQDFSSLEDSLRSIEKSFSSESESK